MDDVVCSVLWEFNRIAVVGLSDNPWRDSNYVATYLLEQGYLILPVNPHVSRVLGLKAYADLLSTPGPVEVVEVFRRADAIAGVVDQAIEVGAKAIWIEGGFIDAALAARTREAGLRVVMDRCMAVEHEKHLGIRK
jgi:predicted CoA-binding protein